MRALSVRCLFLLLFIWGESEAYEVKVLVGNGFREPSGIKVGDTFYSVHISVDKTPNTQIHSSKDLRTWKVEKRYKDEEISEWMSNKDNRIYSPEIHKFGGRFNLYYDSLEAGITPGCKSIGVAASGYSRDSPVGPFKDIGRPLLSLCPEWVLNPHVAHDGMHLYY